LFKPTFKAYYLFVISGAGTNSKVGAHTGAKRLNFVCRRAPLFWL